MLQRKVWWWQWLRWQKIWRWQWLRWQRIWWRKWVRWSLFIWVRWQRIWWSLCGMTMKSKYAAMLWRDKRHASPAAISSFLFLLDNTALSLPLYLDVIVFRVKDNSTPETHLKKYLTLLLSLLNTKGRKSGFRPHGAIIHWSGIFEPPERSPGVLGRITQDNVFKSKVQQSSGILRTLLNCRNCTKSTEVRRTCRCRRRTNRKWGIMPPTKNLW